MSYDTEKVKLGREPVTMCGLVVDACANTFSVFPCTASASPWNLSQASYSNKSIYVNPEDTSPTGIALKIDGLSMYMVGSSGDNVYQYDLSIAYDISTATYSGKSFSISSESG
ncbi:MAG: hypothetical protein KAT71_08005, partial [Gammaproteobacteria bacterium]|nr:hypothetical protein [Gammaproteobacteria bacterium]